jgi:hypothetical protein
MDNMTTYIRPRSVKEQIADLRKDNVSDESIKMFIELSVRTGKITQAEANSLMTA